MLPDKSFLLEQINSVIKKNLCKKKPEHNAYPAKSDLAEVNGELINKNYFSNSRNLETLKKLEQRIDALEDQNDHLLYFIHFLYKNFPDLISDILTSNNYEVNGRDPKEEFRQFQPLIKNDPPSITRREIEILHLLVKGLCAKEIATTLFISETTVITHNKNLKEKFNSKNTVELISKAYTILFKTSKSVF